MTLFDQFERIETQLDSHVRSADVEQLRNRAKSVRELLYRRQLAIEELTKKLTILHQNGVSIESTKEIRTDLVKTFEQLQQAYANNPTLAILQIERWEQLNLLESELEEQVEALYQQTVEAWRGEAIPSFYRWFAREGELKQVVERLQEIDANLPRFLPEEFPLDPIVLEKARRFKTEREEMLKRLDTVIPKDVTTVLRKIGEGYTTLSDLTPEAMNWLRECGMDRMIRLHIR